MIRLHNEHILHCVRGRSQWEGPCEDASRHTDMLAPPSERPWCSRLAAEAEAQLPQETTGDHNSSPGMAIGFARWPKAPVYVLVQAHYALHDGCGQPRRPTGGSRLAVSATIMGICLTLAIRTARLRSLCLRRCQPSCPLLGHSLPPVMRNRQSRLPLPSEGETRNGTASHAL